MSNAINEKPDKLAPPPPSIKNKTTISTNPFVAPISYDNDAGGNSSNGYGSDTVDEDVLNEIMMDRDDDHVINDVILANKNLVELQIVEEEHIYSQRNHQSVQQVVDNVVVSPKTELHKYQKQTKDEVNTEDVEQLNYIPPISIIMNSSDDDRSNQDRSGNSNENDVKNHDENINNSSKVTGSDGDTDTGSQIESKQRILPTRNSPPSPPPSPPPPPTIAAEPRPPEWIEYNSTLQPHQSNSVDNEENQNVYKLHKDILSGNEKFVDTSFPSNLSSITGATGNENINSARKRMPSFSEHVQEEQVQWLRIPDIIENVSYIRFTWHRNLNKLDTGIFTNLLHATTTDNLMRISGISAMTLKEVEYKKQCFAMDESWVSIRHEYMDTAKAAALSGMVGQIDSCAKLFDNELKDWCLSKHGNNKNTNGYNFFEHIKSKAFPCKFERDITVAYFYAEYPMDRENPQLSAEFANGLHIPKIDDEAIVHVICALHFNSGPKCLFAKEYCDSNMAGFFEKDYYENNMFDKRNSIFDALGCLVTAGVPTKVNNKVNVEDDSTNDKKDMGANKANKNSDDSNNNNSNDSNNNNDDKIDNYVQKYHSIPKLLFPKISKYHGKMKIFEDQQLNDNGAYLVELFFKNEKKLVLVDDQIPCDNFGMPLFTKPLKPLKERKLKSYLNPSLSCPSEYWPLLIEKAYAKIHGSYYNMRLNLEEQNEMDYLRSKSSLVMENNNVGNKNKMTELCNSLNAVTGGVSTTFQWNLRTGRGYRDGILDWFISPASNTYNSKFSSKMNSSKVGSLEKISEVHDDHNVAMSENDDESIDLDSLSIDGGIFDEDNEAHEEAAKTLFRRLRTIAIGEENKDTIFIVKERNDDDDDMEIVDDNDANIYVASNILNKDRDSLTWILDDPTVLNTRQSFVSKLSSPLIALSRPWNIMQQVGNHKNRGNNNKNMDNEIIYISMTNLYKKFRAITVHHTCNKKFTTGSPNNNIQFKYNVNIPGQWYDDNKGYTSMNNPQYKIFTKKSCNSIMSIETLSDKIEVTERNKNGIYSNIKFSSSSYASTSRSNSPEKDQFQVLPAPSSVGLLLEKRVPDNANESLGKKRFQIGLPNNRVENGLRYSKYINHSHLSVSLESTLLDNVFMSNNDEDVYFSSDDEEDKEDVPYILVPVSMDQTNYFGKCSNKYMLSIYSSEPLTIKELKYPNHGGYNYYLTVNGIIGKKVGRSGHLISPLKMSLKSRSSMQSGISRDKDVVEYGGSYPKHKSWWLNPQYMFEVKNGNHTVQDGNKTEVLIVLNNKTEVTRRGLSKTNASPTWPSIGFVVVKCETPHFIRFLSSKIYVDIAKCENVPTVLKTLFLDNGKYIVVPYGHDPSVAFEFTLNVYCDIELSPKNFVLLNDWDSHICWKSHWVQYFCGGCCNNKKTWLNNPTATFEIFIKEDAEESESDDDDVNFAEVGKADKTCSVFIEILGKHMDKTPVGFFIYSGLPPYNPNKYHDDDPKFIGQPWIQKQFVGKFKSGAYTIVAQTFDPFIYGDFIIHLYSDDGVLIPGRCIGRNGGAGGAWISNERKSDVCI